MDEDTVLEAFKSASDYVRIIAGRLKSDDLLYLYARFKQANDGRCNTQRPGFFDFQGKQKWDAWNSLKDKSSLECMEEYVAKVTDVDPSWEDNVKSGVRSKSGLGVGVSRLANDEVEIEDGKKTIFDWCKEGDAAVVDKFLTNGHAADVDAADENGMSLLHWVCDRGHEDLVRMLIDRGANVNIQDSDLQTPLHYAVSCNYPEIVRMLTSSGADVTVKDADGISVLDLADCQLMTLLSSST